MIVMLSGVVLVLLVSGKVFVGKGWMGVGEDVVKVFVVGVCGIVVGIAAAFAACGRVFGMYGVKIVGCLCVSYIGGSLNFVVMV